DNNSTKTFVFGESRVISWTMRTSPAFNRSVNALRRARYLVLRDTVLLKSRGLGPKTTPPPRQRGEANEPARARPVPFCFQGFLLVPATSPTFLVQAVPLSWAALKATTVS